MEKILQSNEVWFSNPLFMNDLQELRFGLYQGARLFADAELLKKAAGSDARATILQHAFSHYYQHFDNNDAFDTYIFCVSEHKEENTDGLLSMWRGYGQHGNGAALVFDMSALTMVPTSPLIISKVKYARDEQRIAELVEILGHWSAVTARLQLPDDKLYLAAHVAFMLIKAFALTSKHKGFEEEQEWRVIYYPERDREGLLKPYLGYHIGDRGVEPKLKYVIGYIAEVSAPDLVLNSILKYIILGPSVSSPLAKRSVERMLESIGRPEFKNRVHTSGIPLRPGTGGSF
jgi:hypothetical protein